VPQLLVLLVVPANLGLLDVVAAHAAVVQAPLDEQQQRLAELAAVVDVLAALAAAPEAVEDAHWSER
jgi:hypothetical protein